MGSIRFVAVEGLLFRDVLLLGVSLLLETITPMCYHCLPSPALSPEAIQVFGHGQRRGREAQAAGGLLAIPLRVQRTQ